MFRIQDDNSKWKFVRREIFEIFTACGTQNQDKNRKNSKSFLVTNKQINKSLLVGIMDEIKTELREDSEKFVIEQSQRQYNQIINAGYFKIDGRFNN